MTQSTSFVVEKIRERRCMQRKRMGREAVRLFWLPEAFAAVRSAIEWASKHTSTPPPGAGRGKQPEGRGPKKAGEWTDPPGAWGEKDWRAAMARARY